jgi:hypothetical protein
MNLMMIKPVPATNRPDAPSDDGCRQHSWIRHQEAQFLLGFFVVVIVITLLRKGK